MTDGVLSELQLSVMASLWELGQVPVSAVQRHLAQGGRPLAPTTVATLLRRLEAQGWVHQRREGRRLLYSAAVARGEVAVSAVDRLVGTLFGGNAGALFAQLVDAGRVSRRDLERMRSLVERAAPVESDVESDAEEKEES